MTSITLSVSLPTELLARADQLLALPGEERSALIARVLAQAVRAAEEADIDAVDVRALPEHAITQVVVDRTNAIARAALLSIHGLRPNRGASV
jgi:metal-responsive CopG/Arc/MetJ family transcriptional regulator